MSRFQVIAVLFALGACAAETDASSVPDLDEQAGAEAVHEALTPVWMRDTGHLAEDSATLDGCFVSALQHNDSIEEPCIGVVADECRYEIGEAAAMTTGGARGCAWRELAGWEGVLNDVVGRLSGELTGAELAAFEAVQADWTAFMLSEVRARSARYEGGSLQGLVAAQERARLVAKRAVALRAWRRERAEMLR